jgi:acyl-homoserine lactone acylase PvdQ
MGDINRAQAVLLPGQSAQLFHPQRTPMLDMWRNVEYHPVFFQQSDVENEATDVLILQPE